MCSTPSFVRIEMLTIFKLELKILIVQIDHNETGYHGFEIREPIL